MGFGIRGFEFRVSGFGCRISGQVFRDWGFGVNFGFRFRVLGLRFQISRFGLGFRCHSPVARDLVSVAREPDPV
jgi:hypothetical protein